jgi:hypothetical protein
LARLTAGAHQLNLTPSFGLQESFQKSLEFSMRERQPRSNLLGPGNFLGPPAPGFAMFDTPLKPANPTEMIFPFAVFLKNGNQEQV